MLEIVLYSADKESVPDLHFRVITLAVVDGWTGGHISFD